MSVIFMKAAEVLRAYDAMCGGDDTDDDDDIMFVSCTSTTTGGGGYSGEGSASIRNFYQAYQDATDTRAVVVLTKLDEVEGMDDEAANEVGGQSEQGRGSE